MKNYTNNKIIFIGCYFNNGTKNPIAFIYNNLNF